MYVYIQSEPGMWTVGFYAPEDIWHAESDHLSQEAAADRVHWLNGGRETAMEHAERELDKIGDNLDRGL